MSRYRVVRSTALAAAIAVLASGAASAQVDEPLPTPPPSIFKGVKTAVVTSALTDPASIAIIDSTALAAHAEIGGRPRAFTTETLPTRRGVAVAARDLAELGNDIVLVNGGDSQSTVGSAGLFPETTFVDIGQPPPCVTTDGRPDPSQTCAGGTRGIPFNYSSVAYAVDQGAYLAGIVAAGSSRNDRLGIISGVRECDECNAYIEGFTLGARSVKPAIEIDVAYLAENGDVAAGFGANTAGKVFAEAFINVHEPDVLFPIAGAGSRAMIEAACDAGIIAIGSEIDVTAAYPTTAECLYSSVAKDLEVAVRESVFSIANGSLQRQWLLDLNSGGVITTEEWRQVPGLPVDLPARFEQARQEIAVGLVDTCPTQCPDRVRAVFDEEPDPSASPGAEAEPSIEAEPAAGE